MFEQLSSEPIYNTRAVVQRTGVPADTFRAWERRYRIPTPMRDSGNRRLYSEVDVSVINWLRDQTRTGVTITQAIAMYRMHNDSRSTIPTLVRPNESATTLLERPGSRSEPPFPELRRELFNALNSFDGTRAKQILFESLSICSVENVCLELLYGAYLEFQDGLRTPSEPPINDRFAYSFVHRKLGALLTQSDPDEGNGPIIAACPDGEPREIDLLLMSLFLSRHGYKIVYLGGNVPDNALIHTIAITRPSLVLLAASNEDSVDAIKQSIRSLKSAPFDLPQIAFGGHVFVWRPELLGGIDAIYVGRDAREAVSNVDLIHAQITA